MGYYNTFIQTWIRAPGCLYHAIFTWIGWRNNLGYFLKHSFLPEWGVVPACFVVLGTFFWNGMYFQERVTTNYGYKMGLLEAEKKKKKIPNGAPQKKKKKKKKKS